MDPRGRRNPFPGLRAFIQEEADLFFGRDGQTDELVRRLATRRFLAVVGTSGSGKSSLVRAGLLPSLDGGLLAGAGAQWRMVILRPQDDPIGFLARGLVETAVLAHLELAAPEAEGVVETILRRSSLGLAEVARVARLEPHENLLIVVDQFEELFRFADLARQRGAGDEATAFVKLLLEATRQTEVPVYVVITMRSDFLGDCARFRDLPEVISDSQYLIPRLTRDELQAVITGPIGVRGGRIAPSLVQRLLNDVGDDMDQLPVLQHALMRAWDHWERSDPDGRPIELSDLDAIGGMAEALSLHADEAFGSLVADHNRALAERLFKCLTERGPDNREIRRPTPLAHIAAIANADLTEVIPVIDVFRAPGRSFLMPQHELALEGDSVIDISHESLIRQWGRLRTWVGEEAESRATYLRLVQAAQLHLAGKAGLWGEPDLTYARQWQEREVPNAAWAERYGEGFEDAGAFLRDSEAAHAAELEQECQRVEGERMAQERELEQAKTLAEAQRQRADEQVAAGVRQRRLIWGLGAFLGLALGTAWFGWYQRGLAHEGRLVSEEQTKLAERNAREAGEQRKEAKRQEGLALASAATADEQRDKAVAARKEAEKQRSMVESALTKATSLKLAIQSKAILDGSLPGGTPLGLQLALAAFRLAPGPETSGAIQTAENATFAVFWIRASNEAIAFSADGRRIVSSNNAEGMLRVWDAATGALLYKSHKGHTDAIASIAFSPNGERMVSGSMDKTLRLWDAATGSPLGEPLSGHTGAVTSVAFSRDGTRIVSGSADKTLRLWNAATGSPLGEPLRDGHAGPVASVAFSPDGNRIVSGSLDYTLRLWNAATRMPIGQPLRAHSGEVVSVAFSPDGHRIVSGGYDRRVCLWNASTGELFGDRRFEGHTDGVQSVAFNSDGSRIVSGSWDHSIRLWDAATGAAIGEPLQGHTDKVWGVAFSPDGQRIASSSTDGTLRLWSAVGGGPLMGHTAPVQSVAFSPDGKTIVSGSWDKTLRLWDAATGQPRGGPLEGGKTGEVTSVAWSPDGQRIGLGSLHGTVLLRDSITGVPLGEPYTVHSRQVASLAFSPDGRHMVSGSWDGAVRLWDGTTGRPIGQPRRQDSAIFGVAFSPDGKRIVSGSWRGIVLLQDAATGEVIGVPRKEHAGVVSAVAFSPDGKRIVSGGHDATLRLWDASTGEALGDPLKGHSRQVTSVAFSPDGKRIVSGAHDQTLRLWDTSTGTPLGEPLRGHHAAVLSVAFSPDGTRIVSGSDDGTVRLWRVGQPAHLCARLESNLSRTEWKRFVGDIGYVKQCASLPVSPK